MTRGWRRGRERERERKIEIENARLFSTSTQPGWRRIAAQCSSNGAALRRDHAAAPCATDRPISGTRERKKIIFPERAEASASEEEAAGSRGDSPSRGENTSVGISRAVSERNCIGGALYVVCIFGEDIREARVCARFSREGPRSSSVASTWSRRRREERIAHGDRNKREQREHLLP